MSHNSPDFPSDGDAADEQGPLRAPSLSGTQDAAAGDPTSQGPSAATSSRTISSKNTAVPPAVVAQHISVRGDQGPVYGPLDVTIPGEGLTILSGRGGSGRTALALTISGRMKSETGSLEVLGFTERNQIRQHVAIAGVEEIDQLDRDVPLRLVLTEHRAWSRLWISPRKKADQDYYESICRPVFGKRDLPPIDAYVGQINSLDRILIRISLALAPANHEEIGMLVMDDLEQVHEFEDRMVLLDILCHLAQSIPVVVNAVNPLPAGLLNDYTQIELFTDEAHIQPENVGANLDRIRSIPKELHR